MNIVLLTGHPYPIGTAQSNRIRSYLEPLAAIGHNVNVLIYRPTEDKGNAQNKSKGRLNGISYKNTAFSIFRYRGRILPRLSWIYSYINCIIVLFFLNKKNKTDVIIQASSKSSIIPLTFIFCKIYNIKYILETSEYPWFILFKKRLCDLFYKPLYLWIYYRFFDGILTMTKNLQKYHMRYKKRSATIFHLPMTVDMNRFSVSTSTENIITYIGNNSYEKDGVGTLIKAFEKIVEKYPSWRLVIIGDTGRDQEIYNYIKSKNLLERIELKGSVHRDMVPKMLCKSKILALARPDRLQSEGGFPTKLGEYLATGNLVIITSVGEIPDYLVDGQSALIAKPDNINDFTYKLEYGIKNYDSLETVRRAGYNVCFNTFNSKVQGERLSNFLISLT